MQLPPPRILEGRQQGVLQLDRGNGIRGRPGGGREGGGPVRTRDTVDVVKARECVRPGAPGGCRLHIFAVAAAVTGLLRRAGVSRAVRVLSTCDGVVLGEEERDVNLAIW
ncbi:hypothetical protein VFPFJ_09411 [Purpureocillium lilacinum]|uniref:Uncharacterized protein n=1 Tax=Purpureocillium lilacinum TaxID=33203 RepID=A0A179GU18_PURLI|nr:hypothetical protein VFPFJ_09411 [Purpureocillium lilacinum]OAQ75328.1 hypothetical protein VFPBJ_09303 [Purpureocillium lilacinum]OAQ80958.1 hypothetical protein VFPFJ_09411 [Purpureocillium lilacinum]